MKNTILIMNNNLIDKKSKANLKIREMTYFQDYFASKMKMNKLFSFVSSKYPKLSTKGFLYVVQEPRY